VEQSATPWRVFDAPPNSTDPDSPGGAPAPSGGRATAPAVGPARRAIAGLAGALVIGAIAVVLALSGSGGSVVDAPGSSGIAAGGQDVAQLAGAAEVVVDLTGAVQAPGIYRLPIGSRVADAIDAAGGFSPRVDAAGVASALNLAATLTDGLQLHVPSRDDPATLVDGAGGGGGGGTSGLVDLNTATESELDALPGVGPVTAKKIIDARTAQPFTAIDDLRTRKLVGEKAFDQLKSLVTVR
jgi:competence protein ComEA